MSARSRSRTVIVLLLSLVAALSTAQTAGIMPNLVSAHSTSIQLTRALGSSEPQAASGTVEVDDSGQLNIQLQQATPNSAYLAVFASGSGNVQLGTLTTDDHGEGQLQDSLNSGAYAGIFELLRAGAIQFVSTSINLNIGTSASFTTTLSTSSTTQSSTETQSETETQSITQTASSQIISNGDQANFKVDPNFASVSAGEYAKFEIQNPPTTSLVPL